MYALLNGGPAVEWEQSIRGRLHRVTQTLDTADKLAEALREVRRERSQRWTKGERIFAAAVALLAAVAPYALFFAAR
jgi:hypothetical protein